MNRLNTVKSILWALVSVGIVLAITRFISGLGVVTDLSDDVPWGLWIVFDVMGGVALAAGGFVIAATVYIFHLDKYKPIVRPAVLTAFLGYNAVGIGLMFDLGIPWRIWHAMIYWQHHSVLFEVAWCVMLYLTVLALEFAPVVFEHKWLQHPLLQTIHRMLKWATIPLVIAGIVLSTLHQSSLGSLFLIMPHRLHALWYSPLLPLLFFVTAIGLGLMMVTLESFFSTWLFNHKPKQHLLAGLGKAASIVLFLYVALRLIDLTVRGQIGLLFDPSWQSMLFTFEIMVSALIPAILLSFASLRARSDVLLACSIMVVFGMVLYRFDVGLIAIQKLPGSVYFPTWIEIMISASLVSGAALVYIFCAENFKLFIDEDHAEAAQDKIKYSAPVFDAVSNVYLGDSFRKNVLVFSTISILVVGITAALLPGTAFSGYRALDAPVQEARGLDILTIDGNRSNEFVRFDHKDHAKRLSDMLGAKEGCIKCHHANLPKDGVSSCSSCHSDMYNTTSIFNHESHVEKMKGNKSCVQCHPADQSKSKVTVKRCTTCHQELFKNIENSKENNYAARSYFEAMHALCIPCHTEHKTNGHHADLDQCKTCHTNPPSDPMAPINILLIDKTQE